MTWYTWIEQGRDVQVSVQVLEGIARALKLNLDERNHLFLLADQSPPIDPIQPQEGSETKICGIGLRKRVVISGPSHEMSSLLS